MNAISKANIALVKNAAIAAVGAKDGMNTAVFGLKDALILTVGTPTVRNTKVWMAAVAAVRLAVCGKLAGIQKLKDTAGAKSPAERTQDEKMSLVYGVISATASRMMSDLKTGKNPGKRKVGRKNGSVSTVKVTGTARQVVSRMTSSPKALATTLKLVVASLQANEGKGFRQLPEVIASMQVTLGLL